MIVTVEMPGGSLAQGDLILQIGTYATVNAGGIICGGTLIERETRAKEPAGVIFRCQTVSGTMRAVSGEKSEAAE